MSCSCLIRFLFKSYSFLIHSYSFPIHCSSFHFQGFSKKAIRKWKEIKWSERRGKESKCSQWSNPESWVQYIYQYKIQYIIPNTFTNKESIAHKDSFHNQLKNFISYPSIVGGGGGVINHFSTLAAQPSAVTILPTLTKSWSSSESATPIPLK